MDRLTFSRKFLSDPIPQVPYATMKELCKLVQFYLLLLLCTITNSAVVYIFIEVLTYAKLRYKREPHQDLMSENGFKIQHAKWVPISIQLF